MTHLAQVIRDTERAAVRDSAEQRQGGFGRSKTLTLSPHSQWHWLFSVD